MAPQKYEKTEALTRFSWEMPLFSTNISTGFIANAVYPIEDRIDVKNISVKYFNLFKRPTFLFHGVHSDFKEHNATTKRNLVNQASLHNTNRYQRIQQSVNLLRDFEDSTIL